MNHALQRLADHIDLRHETNERLRLQFSLACVQRIEALLEKPEARWALGVLACHLAGSATHEDLARAAEQAARIANSHPGSASIDGCGHAAVSATYAVAAALAGKAIDAANYSAYAAVYAQGGYAAVADPEAFDTEYAWQTALLESLRHGGTNQTPQAS